MDYKTLSIFVTLADSLHFRQASQIHHMTPSTLSRIIQRLEEELECKLFIRDNKSVIITKQGEEFYSFAKDALTKFEILQHNLHSNDSESLKGSITIECTVTIAYGVLPHIIKAFIEKYPNISLNITTASPERSMKRLIDNAVDFVIQPIFGGAPVDTKHKIISSSKLVVVGSPSLPKIQSLKDLEKLPVIVSKYPAIVKIIEKIFKDNDVEPMIHSYVDGNEATLAMVAAGLGYAILPEIVLENSHLEEDVVVMRDLVDLPTVDAAIFMKEHKYHSPAKLAFWEFIQQG
ncbi:MAG: LysR substrate-binding domain-containing protein [Proteobacteria bacterium]|nr:LysR substrate-binding domain-containing protein [Pseudomonadota bacterium]